MKAAPNGSMRAHIDDPIAGSVVDGCAFFVRGWIQRSGSAAEIEAVRVTINGQLIAETTWFFDRPDVAESLGVPQCEVKGFFAFSCEAEAFHGACVELAISLRVRNAPDSDVLSSVRFSFLPLERNPLALLRTRIGEGFLGVEVGAHTNPDKHLKHYYVDAEPAFAGVKGKADFLADASALPLPSESLDYFYSSHVLEHLVDPIRALFEWHRVLKPGGHLYLVVPDKRVSFDAPRATTSAYHMLRDFRRAVTAAQSVDHIDDFVFNADWAILRPDLPAGQREAARAAARARYTSDLLNSRGVDIHFHTFTPSSLDELLRVSHLLSDDGFRVEASAENYPGDRRDGIAMLLVKQPSLKRPAVNPPATHILSRECSSLPPLPLVCPACLKPLARRETSAGEPSLSCEDGSQYKIVDGVPDLRCATGSTVTRRWTRWHWRWRHFVGSLVRLAMR